LIIAHGFKGFKDWGHFPLVARWFAEKGMAFVRFNFSHNGTTPEQPADFANLDNFGKNNFSIELHDLDDVINWVEANAKEHTFDIENIFLIGHSRGGGISIIKASEDARVKKIVTWASVADFESRLKVDGFDEWKKTGIAYIPNSRTNQNMPLYFQFYEDFDKNRARLLIKKAAKKINIPFLIVHGTEDDTVSLNEANALHQWAKGSRMCLIEKADHAFNATHPYNAQELNEHILKKLKVSLDFLVNDNID
jgi:dienelactone hydrolase